MTAISLTGTVKDLFKPGLSPFTGKKLLVDVLPVGSCERYGVIATDQKVVVDAAYVTAMEAYYGAAGWSLSRIDAAIAAMVSPPKFVLEGLAGNTELHIGLQNYTTATSSALNENGMLTSYCSMIGACGYVPTGAWAQQSVDGADISKGVILQTCDVDSWSIPVDSTMLAILDSPAMYWDQGMITAQPSATTMGDMAAKFSQTADSDAYALVLIPNGFTSRAASGYWLWIPRFVPREAWMTRYALFNSITAYEGRWWNKTTNVVEYWRDQGDNLLSALGTALGMTPREKYVTPNSASATVAAMPGYDGTLYDGAMMFRGNKPWFVYGWSGTVDAIYVRGVGELALSAGFASDPTGVGYLRVTPSDTRTYVSKGKLVQNSTPPADATQEELDNAAERLAQLDQSGLTVICAQSVSTTLDLESMAQHWAPYSAAIDDELDPDEMFVDDNVSVRQAYDKARSAPATKDKLLMFGVYQHKLRALTATVYVTSMGSGVDLTYALSSGGVNISADQALAQIACGAVVSGTTSTVNAWFTSVKGSLTTLTDWRLGDEADDIRSYLVKYAKRAPEYYQTKPLGVNWRGGQYAVDNAVGDRTKGCKDIHAMRGWSFAHRIPTITSMPTALVVESTTITITPTVF